MNALTQLVEALRYLPGVGPKSAQRMAYYLLQKNRKKGLALADALQNAMENIGHCQQCHNFSEHHICSLCADKNRNSDILCIVESPAHVAAIEQSQTFKHHLNMF